MYVHVHTLVVNAYTSCSNRSRTLLCLTVWYRFWFLCVFRNLCLSTRPNCKKDDLLLLWEHECQWVFGHRMVNSVDFDRYSTTFFQAVRKTFTSDEHVSRD